MHRLHVVSVFIIVVLLMGMAACGGRSESAEPEAVAQESASGEASADEASSDEAAAEDTAADEATTEEASSDETAADETAAEETASEDTAADEATAEEAASDEASSDEAAAEAGEEEMQIEPIHAELDPTAFTTSTNIDNEWMPMQPGMHWVYEGETIEEGESIPHRIEFTVTDLTKEIDGVPTVVAWVVDISDDEIVETELSFYAQDDNGTVWYFGEYPEEYEEGELVAAPGWIAGQEEARAGVKMVQEPQLDTPVYYQGWAPAVDWSDFGVVARMGEEVCVAFDCYEDVLVIDESSLEEIGAFQQKFYARDVGNISVEWSGDDLNQETLELISFETLDDASLSEIHDLALEQETRAYENMPDIYGDTAPME